MGENIFNKYKNNLNLLIDSGILTGNKDVYICPLKLEEHATLNGDDPLTFEHVPQHSLGGRASILTNKSVNNKCGVTIDLHLIERLKQLERKGFFPNSKIPIEIKDKNVRGTLEIDEKGKRTLRTNERKNNPNDFGKFVDKNKAGDILNIGIYERGVVDLDRAKYALLKNAYLLFFEKCGYAYIFDKCFDTIRNQILNPEKKLIPEKFYMVLPDNVVNNGVYFVKEKGIESIFVVFDLKCESYSKKFGVFLPLGKNSLFKISKNLKRRFKKEKRFLVNLQPITDDFLTDIDKINEYAKWIDSIKL